MLKKDGIHELSSVTFNSILKERWLCVLGTDIDVDDNFMNFRAVNQLIGTGAVCSPKLLLQPREFDMEAQLQNETPATITCKREATLDLKITILYGTTLVL